MKKFWLIILIPILTQLSCTSEDGLDGEIGPQGLQGLQGEVGPAGEDGSKILAGSGEPAEDLGKIGDLYLDKDTGHLFGPKIDDTTWGDSTLLGTPGANGVDGVDGQDGIDGSQIFAGDVPPENTFGQDGDYYLNRSAYDLYGPKTTGDWGTPINLKGTTDVRYTDWFNFEDVASLRTDFTYIDIKAFGFMNYDYLDQGGSVLVYSGYVTNSNLGNVPIRPKDVSLLSRFDSNGANDWKESFLHQTYYNLGQVYIYVEALNTTATSREQFLQNIYQVDNRFFKIVFIPGGTLVGSRNRTKQSVDYNNYEEVKEYYGIKD